jgi:uncharacterized protein (DUF1330 family)
VNLSYKVIVAALAGLVAGTAAGRAIYGQLARPTPVYVISEADEVTDLAALKDYGSKVAGTLAPFNGQYHFVVRGGKTESLDGGTPPHGTVVIAFDSAEAAHAWYDSPAYQAIKPIRLAATKGRMFIVEGAAQ